MSDNLKNSLNLLRDQIDLTNQNLVKTLQEREILLNKIFLLKKSLQLPIYDQVREQEMMLNVKLRSENSDFIIESMESIFRLSLEYLNKLNSKESSEI